MTSTYAAEPSSAPMQQPRLITMKGTLKWFNATKGFGFVVPESFNGDAFMHISVLQRANIKEIGEGATFLCQIFKTSKGLQISEIIELIEPGSMGDKPIQVSSEEGEVNTYLMSGTVKWYKDDKGYGFVTPEDGMKDIFIHKSCLDRHGLDTLLSGQRLKMTIKDVNQGREAIKFEFEEEA